MTVMGLKDSCITDFRADHQTNEKLQNVLLYIIILFILFKFLLYLKSFFKLFVYQ